MGLPHEKGLAIETKTEIFHITLVKTMTAEAMVMPLADVGSLGVF